MDADRATPVVLSELFPWAKLITGANDFRRYRRLRNQTMRLAMLEKL